MDPLGNTFARRRANQNREQNAIILSQNSQTTDVGYNSSVAATAAADLVVEQIMQETNLQNQRHRAKNTNTSYDPKIKEFKSWCDQIYGAADPSCGYTVTEGKLVAFLQTCVINRKSKTSDREVGISTVKAYRNAVVDLYKTQVLLKINSHPHPGLGKTVSELIKSVKREKVDRMKRNYVDRGREGFRMKSFTTEQLHAISNYHWNRTDKACESLRENMAEFNMRAMSLRGEHLRSVELPDLFIDDIGEQGHGECKAVKTVLNRGKTNKYGNNEFAAMFRSKCICAHKVRWLFIFFIASINPRKSFQILKQINHGLI